MSPYPTIPPPPQSNLSCLLLKLLNHSIKFDIVSLTLHSSHLKNVGKFCNLMYSLEFFVPLQILTPWIICVLIKGGCLLKLTNVKLREAIICSLKNLKTISWNHHMEMCLKSSTTSLYDFWKWVNEMLSPMNILYAFRFYMVYDGTLKGLRCGSIKCMR